MSILLELAPPVLAALVAAGAAYTGCRWHYGRRLVVLDKRIALADAARHLGDERAQQARRQIEQLQRDLTAARAGTAPAAAPAPAVATANRQQLDQMLREGDRTRGTAAKASAPVDGFADTLPM